MYPRKSIDDIKEVLKSLAPSKNLEKASLFSLLYPEIRAALDRHVPQNDIRKKLAEHGLPLSPATFKKFLQACDKPISEQATGGSS